MDPLVISIILLLVLFLLLGTGIWVSFSLLSLGMLALALFSNAPVGEVMATTLWASSHEWSLAALPLFVWMGEILYRTKLAEDMFTGLAPWLRRLPGGLLHINVFGCALFAAVSGSSAATAATIGKMTIPELTRRKYPENMVLGTLAGSATLGFLIPPSIILIVYGVSTEQSISRLFVAGILPGFMLVTLFMLFIILWALLGRKKLPVDDEQYTFKEKIYRSRRIIPVLLLILGILGSIYSGIASPTDAAAVGVVLALVFSWLTGSMNRETFFGALEGAVLTSCMIAFILAGAAVLTVAMGFTGLPRMLASWIATMELSPYMLLAALTAFFVIMGLFLDGISVVVLTTSIIIPMVEAVGIDLLWFGIFLVLVVEMAQITPPVGFNLFVLQSLTGKDIFYIARAAIPFFIVMVLALVILTIFPELATWLPGKMAF